MIEISHASLTQLWAYLSWRIFYGLTNPFLVSITILAIALFPLLLNLSRWKHRLSKPALILLVTYWIIISPPVTWLATQALMLFVPADSGASADAIVVLSRGEEVENARYATAIQLWRTHRAPRIFVTGEKNLAKTLKLLEKDGISQPVLSGSACSITTYDEAISTAALLGPQGIKKIILMTDPPHMLRSFLTFSSLGFSVIPYVNPLPASLSFSKKAFLALREYLGLASYALLGRFQAQPTEQLTHPPQPVIKQVVDRHCDIKVVNPEEI
jgi:uncharacterized SAM-binding protein YcdF (DUF218 family)